MRCCSACGAVYRAEIDRCTNDGAQVVETEQDPMLGRRIGSYVVDRFIGEGGMGRVYEAHHTHLTHKRVALKVLIGDYSGTPAMRIRFAKEAEHASKLAHPNIAAVSDFGRSEDGLLFLAMELVEGTTLDRLLPDTPMAPARVIALARQLCAGLAHAHDLGLIHRDFKPENVIVVDTPDGEVPKIVDFGLVIERNNTDARVTSTGFVMGTPGYVAPEQCLDGPIDHRIDLYALGVTLFELLSGGFLPFDGNPAEVVGLKVSTPAPTLAERAPDVSISPGLVALVDRLLARKPDNRLASAAEVLDALDEIERHPSFVAPRRRLDDTVVEHAQRRAAEHAARSDDNLRTGIVRRPRGPSLLVLGISLTTALAAVIIVALPARTSDQSADGRIGIAAVDRPSPRAVEPPTTNEAPRASDLASRRPDRPVSGPPKVRSRANHAKTKPSKPAVRRSEPIVAIDPPPPEVTPPVTITPPPEPPKVVAFNATINGLTVEGSLPSATVRRALDRVMPSIRACRTTQAGSIDVRFTIGEGRRATGTSARGISPTVAGCVGTAIGGLRTEAAPDVGDVEVHVVVGFASQG
ncbi:MAG: serine/threonine-protein kinase [Kofleriaceae bacterium]